MTPEKKKTKTEKEPHQSVVTPLLTSKPFCKNIFSVSMYMLLPYISDKLSHICGVFFCVYMCGFFDLSSHCPDLFYYCISTEFHFMSKN